MKIIVRLIYDLFLVSVKAFLEDISIYLWQYKM